MIRTLSGHARTTAQPTSDINRAFVKCGISVDLENMQAGLSEQQEGRSTRALARRGLGGVLVRNVPLLDGTGLQSPSDFKHRGTPGRRRGR